MDAEIDESDSLTSPAENDTPEVWDAASDRGMPSDSCCDILFGIVFRLCTLWPRPGPP